MTRVPTSPPVQAAHRLRVVARRRAPPAPACQGPACIPRRRACQGPGSASHGARAPPLPRRHLHSRRARIRARGRGRGGPARRQAARDSDDSASPARGIVGVTRPLLAHPPRSPPGPHRCRQRPPAPEARCRECPRPPASSPPRAALAWGKPRCALRDTRPGGAGPARSSPVRAASRGFRVVRVGAGSSPSPLRVPGPGRARALARSTRRESHYPRGPRPARPATR
jgi:hypothetical protein